ncbi:uncharacterized protein Yip1d1 isoform X4 [Atheta coriaria]|uniref:uncharacterized protein Yip1d1 isoform X4 n=1 Tax=Dalotia coriaria TaxID=877792 RepID=UPI0031F36DB2
MSNYNEQYQFQQQQQPQQQDYWMHDPNQYAGFEQGQADSSYNFEMPVQQDFGKELDFQTFDANVGNVQQSADMYGANPYLNGADAGYYQPGPAAAGDKFEDFEDEPPLLEELGINPDFILQKVSSDFPLRFDGKRQNSNPDRAEPVSERRGGRHAGYGFCWTIGFLPYIRRIFIAERQSALQLHLRHRRDGLRWNVGAAQPDVDQRRRAWHCYHRPWLLHPANGRPVRRQRRAQPAGLHRNCVNIDCYRLV